MKPTIFDDDRRQFHREMADAYLRFLKFIFVENADDAALHKGLRETRNKFLSCYYYENADVAKCFPEKIIKEYRGTATKRYLCADYYSEGALRILFKCEPLRAQLRYEHVVPKAESVQKVCEGEVLNRTNALIVQRVATLLDEHWHMTVICKDEDEKLRPRNKMPPGWTGVMTRYRGENGMHFPLFRAMEDAKKIKSILSNSQFDAM